MAATVHPHGRAGQIDNRECSASALMKNYWISIFNGYTNRYIQINLLLKTYTLHSLINIPLIYK
jgi:hypothetical protein